MIRPIEDHLIAITKKLVTVINVPITNTSIEETLQRHPNYPSLLALVDTLTDFSIENITVKINMVDLKKFSTPFLVHFKKPNERLAMLMTIDNNQISYFDTEKGWVVESFSEFENKWDGIAVLIGTNEKSGEIDYKNKRKREKKQLLRIPFSVLIPFLLLIFAMVLKRYDIPFTLILTKIIGLFVSILLVIQDIGGSNKISAKFCALNRKVSCNDVLNSNAARIFGWLHLSDIGLLYFTGGLFSLIICMAVNQVEEVTQLLSVLAYCALPYTFFSLYYQAFIIKKWCPLCVGIIIVLWIEAILLSFYFNRGDFLHIINITSTYLLLFAYLMPISIWAFIKHFIIRTNQLQSFESSFYRLKYNPDLFQLLLGRETPVSIELQPCDIIIGDTSAEKIITIVVNPFCTPCAKAHEEISKMMEQHPKGIKVLIRFTGNNKKNIYNLDVVATTLIALYYKLDKRAFKDALNTWFEMRTYKKFLTKYGDIEIDIKEGSTQFERHKMWCEKVKITHTPTIFINGKRLPESYSIRDLEKILRYWNHSEEKN